MRVAASMQPFCILYDKICREDMLRNAYALAPMRVRRAWNEAEGAER
ncbi:hypothetical protein [Mesorhizobium amorphae]|uniref:Uncharacterized protein n=1 Tax=Mesorhizobium amorphae CCNWGS0123 TaxID=1082933 RepID=G6YMD6_9HYPH|nr:hypothetical protein [Mesorhizobium amorphae]EHH02144.1 hypothetical protein MEA186_35959 [Mesorhizobium amorphae CCNWGS0123]